MVSFRSDESAPLPERSAAKCARDDSVERGADFLDRSRAEREGVETKESAADEAQDEDVAAVMARLARLNAVEYDKARKAEAEALGIRTSTLDAQVLEARRQLRGNEANVSGTSLTFDPIEPWPGPVDGAELLNEISAMFSRHAILPEHSVVTLALWAVFTHMHEVYQSARWCSFRAP
jgi:putative DNA primase/helicase